MKTEVLWRVRVPNQLFAPMIPHLKQGNSTCSLWRYKTLLGYFYEVFPLLHKLWLKTIMFSDDANWLPKTNKCLMFVWYESSEQSMHQFIHVSSYVGWSHQFANGLQSNNCYKCLGFYSNICHTKHLSDSWEKRDASREKWDDRW